MRIQWHADVDTVDTETVRADTEAGGAAAGRVVIITTSVDAVGVSID